MQPTRIARSEVLSRRFDAAVGSRFALARSINQRLAHLAAPASFCTRPDCGQRPDARLVQTYQTDDNFVEAAAVGTWQGAKALLRPLHTNITSYA